MGMSQVVAQQLAARGAGGGPTGQVPTSRYITVELRGVAYLLAPPNLQKSSGSEAPPEAPSGGTAPTTASNNPVAGGR